MAVDQSFRDRFRSKTLGANATRRTKVIELEGEKIVLKSPSISGQETAQQESGLSIIPSPDGKSVTSTIAHPFRYSIEMVILCCFEPTFGPNGEVTGPGKAMFDAMDREALLEEAMDGWLRTLSDEVAKFNNEKPEQLAKNSEATVAGSSASA